MIHFDGATLGYANKTILSDVHCDVVAGEFVGLAGPNGSGKTTFLRTILGLLPPRGGKVEIDRARRFAYVPQVDDLNLLWPLTVEEIVLLALRGRRLFGRLTETERADANDALAKTGIAALRDRRFSELSGGQRQRTVLASALAQQPDVLLLDEPTRGLDVRVEHDFMNLVTDLHRQKKLTVLFVTHTLQIPLNFAEKILLFNQGRVFATTPDELMKTDKLDAIYGLPFLHETSRGVRWAAPIPEKRS